MEEGRHPLLRLGRLTTSPGPARHKLWKRIGMAGGAGDGGRLAGQRVSESSSQAVSASSRSARTARRSASSSVTRW